jgi:hypothetical protein
MWLILTGLFIEWIPVPRKELENYIRSHIIKLGINSEPISRVPSKKNFFQLFCCTSECTSLKMKQFVPESPPHLPTPPIRPKYNPFHPPPLSNPTTSNPAFDSGYSNSPSQKPHLHPHHSPKISTLSSPPSLPSPKKQPLEIKQPSTGGSSRCRQTPEELKYRATPPPKSHTRQLPPNKDPTTTQKTPMRKISPSTGD